MLVLALLVGGVNYLNQRGLLYLQETLRQIVVAFDTNATTELASLAITILVVDALYEHRETEREKRRLILQMGSPNNAFAREAVRVLRAHGWLQDGSLKGARLSRANLQGAALNGANLEEANLYAADLQGADLPGANLRKAFLRHAKLQGASLWNADLQGADLYDTEYNYNTLWPMGFTPPPEAINVDAKTNVEDGG